MLVCVISLLSDLKFSTDEDLSLPSDKNSKSLQGAWTKVYNDEKGEKIRATAIVMDNYMAIAYYTAVDHKFINTFGGPFQLKENKLVLTLEFHTSDASKVGEQLNLPFDFKGKNGLQFGNNKVKWSRIDHGNKGLLRGSWMFAGRKNNNVISRREPGPRKTVKLLSDSRFQWIAFNTATGEFFGSGGGNYSAEQGVYEEHIDFFSRDNSRVGARLNFNFQLINKEWHHSGLSSKGKPIYEIWSLYRSRQ